MQTTRTPGVCHCDLEPHMRSTKRHAFFLDAAPGLTTLALLALAACGPTFPTDAGPDVDDAGSEDLVRGFVASAAVTGPRLTLDVTLGEGREAVVRVRASEFGDVFGYAFHVVTGALTVPAREALILEPALGGALDAQYAARVDTHIALGAARKTRDANAALTDGLELLRFTVTSDVDGVFPLEVTRAFLRRSDGSVVIPRVEAGVLTLVGGGE